MEKLTDDFIKSGTLNSEDNTWSGRYSAALPDFSLDGALIKAQANGRTSSITSYDEITLFLLVKYLFIPIWLVEQWYTVDQFDILGSEIKGGKDKIKDWVGLNLCWLESSPTGLYLRPTKALFTLFSLEMERFNNIPMNTLTHTVASIDIAHDVMAGNHPILEKYKTLPRQSLLGLPEQESGTNIVCESDFRNPQMWTEKGMDEILKVENAIDRAIEEKKIVTPELTNFRYFSVIKKVGNTGEPKKDYVSHLPDIIIPMIRDKGKPKSIAIEAELTSKGVAGYRESIKRYADNNKFGYVIYLCGGPGVADSIKNAYRQVGGSGSTKFVIMDYMIPRPDFNI